MEIIEKAYDSIKTMLPAGFALVAAIAVLLAAKFVMNKRLAFASDKRLRSQIIMIGLTLAGLLAIILVLPISDSSRGQLLSLIGIVLSAAIALSSTTLLGNAMAGLMLRVVRGFRSGDFIRVGDHFGRISEQGLFHVEIQNEDRDLTTLPNLYLVTNPVKVIRSSGTFISASLSLGYDIPHRKIEKLLLDSAVSSGLEDPFVQIIELGDFSITYRVAGLLKEVKQVISTRSRLHAAILDTLHDAGI
jgi:small conductance mechanosensitive channel